MEQKKKVNASKETIRGIMPRVGGGKVISPAKAYFRKPVLLGRINMKRKAGR